MTQRTNPVDDRLIALAQKRVRQLESECLEIEIRLGCFPKSRISFSAYQSALQRAADAYASLKQVYLQGYADGFADRI